MHTGYRYKPMSGFSGKGHKSYNNPNDKEPPMWKTLLIVIMAVLGVLLLFATGWWALDYFLG